MSHSSNSSGGAVDILKMVLMKILQLVALVIALCFGIVGSIFTAISQFFRNIFEK